MLADVKMDVPVRNVLAGDSPDRYLMTARKKGGPAASQFVITMGDSDDSEESNVVGRLKATSRTSEEFQVRIACSGSVGGVCAND